MLPRQVKNQPLHPNQTQRPRCPENWVQEAKFLNFVRADFSQANERFSLGLADRLANTNVQAGASGAPPNIQPKPQLSKAERRAKQVFFPSSIDRKSFIWSIFLKRKQNEPLRPWRKVVQHRLENPTNHLQRHLLLKRNQRVNTVLHQLLRLSPMVSRSSFRRAWLFDVGRFASKHRNDLNPMRVNRLSRSYPDRRVLWHRQLLLQQQQRPSLQPNHNNDGSRRKSLKIVLDCLLIWQFTPVNWNVFNMPRTFSIFLVKQDPH